MVSPGWEIRPVRGQREGVQKRDKTTLRAIYLVIYLDQQCWFKSIWMSKLLYLNRNVKNRQDHCPQS